MGKQKGCDQMVAAKGDKSANRIRRLQAQLETAVSEPDDSAPTTASSMKYTFPVWPLAVIGAFVGVVLSDSLNGWGAFLSVAAVAVFGFVPWVIVAVGVTYLQGLYVLVRSQRVMKPGRERLIFVEDELWSQVVSLLEARGSKESAHDFLARHFAFFRDNLLVAYEERQACLEGLEETRDPEMATHLWAYITRSLAGLVDGEEQAMQEARNQRQATLRQRFPLPPTDTTEAEADVETDASGINLSK